MTPRRRPVRRRTTWRSGAHFSGSQDVSARGGGDRPGPGSGHDPRGLRSLRQRRRATTAQEGGRTRRRSGAHWVPGRTKAGLAKIQRAGRTARRHTRARGSGPTTTGSWAPSRCCPTAGSPTPRWRGTPAAGSPSRPVPARPRAVRPAAGRPVAEHPLRADRAAQLGDQRSLLGLRPGRGQRPVAALLLRRGGRARPGRALHRRRHRHRPDRGVRPRREAAGLPEAGGLAAGVRQDQAARRTACPGAGSSTPTTSRTGAGTSTCSTAPRARPSSIRMVQLPGSGRPEGNARSTELVRRSGVIENPTMVRRGRQYVLLTSEGDFGECSYKTTFRRSAKLTDWSRAERQVLVDSRKSGLCGPGGADVGRGPSGEPLLFFHAWTCPELGGNCPGGHNYDRDNLYDARRSLFAGVLRFTSRQSPRISAVRHADPAAAAAAATGRRHRRRRPDRHRRPAQRPERHVIRAATRLLETHDVGRSAARRSVGACRRTASSEPLVRRLVDPRRRRAAPRGCSPRRRRTGGR